MTAKRPGARYKAPDGEPLAFFESAMRQDTEFCILWPYGKTEGYGALTINGKRRHAHQLACEREHGPKPPDKDDAGHRCGNRGCINRAHLRWVTRAENEEDKRIHAIEFWCPKE